MAGLPRPRMLYPSPLAAGQQKPDFPHPLAVIIKSKEMQNFFMMKFRRFSLRQLYPPRLYWTKAQQERFTASVTARKWKQCKTDYYQISIARKWAGFPPLPPPRKPPLQIALDRIAPLRPAEQPPPPQWMEPQEADQQIPPLPPVPWIRKRQQRTPVIPPPAQLIPEWQQMPPPPPPPPPQWVLDQQQQIPPPPPPLLAQWQLNQQQQIPPPPPPPLPWHVIPQVPEELE